MDGEGVRRVLTSRLPIARWLPGYRRGDLPSDTVAGVTVAVLLVPQALAYAALAGMPPITGLYTAIGALLVYALLGTSSHVSPGPTAVTALLVAAALQPVAGDDPGRYVALAGLLALMVGAIRMALGLARAGTFMNLVSQPVLTGFTAGAGVLIILSQLGELLGLDVERSDRAGTAIGHILADLGQVRPFSLMIGLACLIALLAAARLDDRVPGPLVVVAVVTAVVWALDLRAYGVDVLGRVPSGLPVPVLPWTDGGVVRRLLPAAVVIALIGYVESVSIAKQVGLQTRERVGLNQELLALGGASVAAGVLGGFPNGGSFSRTSLNHRAGARTQLAGVVAAAVLVVATLLLTPVLRYIPEVALAAIVIYAAIGLFDVGGILEAFRLRRRDASSLAVTFVATVTLGVEIGFLSGAALNILLYLYRVTRPSIEELGRVRGTRTYRNVKRWDVETSAEIVVLRLDAPLNFLSVEAFVDRVNEILADQPEVRGFVLEASTIHEVDATGIHALRILLEQADQAGWDLRFATLHGPVRDGIRKGGLAEFVRERAYPNVADAIRSLDVAPRNVVAPRPEEEAPERVY